MSHTLSRFRITMRTRLLFGMLQLSLESSGADVYLLPKQLDDSAVLWSGSHCNSELFGNTQLVSSYRGAQVQQLGFQEDIMVWDEVVCGHDLLQRIVL